MIRRLWRWLAGPKHGEAWFDGFYMTCRCGHEDRQDWNLAKHLAKDGLQ